MTDFEMELICDIDEKFYEFCSVKRTGECSDECKYARCFSIEECAIGFTIDQIKK